MEARMMFLRTMSGGGLALVFCYLVLMSTASGQATQKELTGVTQDIRMEDLARQEAYKRANRLINEGHAALGGKEYQKAVDRYLESIKQLEKCSASRSIILQKEDAVKRLIAQTYEFWSRDLYIQAEEKLKIQNMADAIKLCEQASEIYPPSKARNDELIKQYQETQKTLIYRQATKEDTVIPDMEQRKFNIDVLMRQARAYYDAGQFEKARSKCEEVLVIDPYNSEAINYVYKVNLTLQKRAKQRFDMTHIERISEAEWKGVSPLIPKTYSSDMSASASPIKKEVAEDLIHKKLKNIIIDHIEFEEVTIPTVVKYLKMRSKQIDPEKVGVNIFLRLPVAGETASASQNNAAGMEGLPPGMPGAAAPRATTTKRKAKSDNADAAANGGGDANANANANAAGDNPDDSSDSSEEGGGEGENTAGLPTVTMVVDEISLDDAIRYICRAANLKYRVEKYAVVIAPQDVPLDDVETQIYPIEHESIDSIGGGDPTAVKQHFETRGVTFPAGAKIVYDSRISRLIATNTPENLKKIEAIIHNELNAIDPQVLIQCKFAEISQNDLDELGFDYAVSNTGYPSFDTNDSVVRNLSSTTQDKAFSATYTDRGYSIGATVHALNQCDTLDILSTPRVTTLNGQEATIRMVRDVYYPSDYSDPQVSTVTGTSNNSSGNSSSTTITSYIGSIPNFDEVTEEGIILKVTPNVDADHYTITLDMSPIIQRFVGWADYSYKVTLDSDSDNPYTVTNILKKAVIAARTVETTVSVYDGETIVLGGVISDQVDSVTDKVPVLGDVPFFGRFFQSQYQTKTKKNLLIFLTCRLVNPDGTPLHERKSRGLPTYLPDR